MRRGPLEIFRALVVRFPPIAVEGRQANVVSVFCSVATRTP